MAKVEQYSFMGRLETEVGAHRVNLWDDCDIEIDGADYGSQCGRLTLDQAIELSTYINCVMIPELEKEENE